MTITKKDFIFFANSICSLKDIKPKEREFLIDFLCFNFNQLNINFDEQKFRKYIAIELLPKKDF